LEAFALDRDLQCMPYGISPMVIYYNRALVDFEAMEARGLDVPSSDENERWTFEEFRVAAEFAARPRRGISGFHVEPTLEGLAPFIYSAGGQVFDDDVAPTSLAFSTDETRSALEDVLPVLRDPRLTLSQEQLAEASAMTWFEDGQLGMIAGYRSWVPALRRLPDLDFDVIAMPTVEDEATVGQITGLCIAADTADVAESADLLVDLISTESVSRVVLAGYLVPANAEVALSDAFLQPGRSPEHSAVYNTSVGNLRIPPLLDDYEELEAAVADPLQELLTTPVPDLDLLTEEIDEASVEVLSPPEEPTESPSATE
jgi:multiple sugar transport system substrate-binding protein